MVQIKAMEPQYAAYLHDESRLMGSARYIAFPDSLSEVVEAVRWCGDRGVPLTAQGSRTGLSGGASPAGGLILNLSRMDRILGIRKDEAGNCYLRVQPGLPLLRLRNALKNKAFDISGWSEKDIEVLRELKAGEWVFPPDPTEPTASIGGMAACNACGARSFLYGSMRAHVTELVVVLADGRTARLRRGSERARGRQVRIPLREGGVFEATLPEFDTPTVKNAGFYIHGDMELIDLFMGSQGTLGIIGELELKLMRAPGHLWGVTAFLPGDEAALSYVEALKDMAHKPAAIEFFGHRALAMVERQRTLTPAFARLQELPEDYGCAVYVEFNDEDNSAMLHDLEELAGLLKQVGADPGDTWVARDQEELEKLLIFRHAVPETIDLIVEKNKKREPIITILSTDMSVDDGHFRELFRMYKEDLSASGLDWVIFGHIGENHVHPNILARTADEYRAGLALFEKWAGEVRRMGGTITAEHGVGKIKKRLEHILYGAEKMGELALLKRSFDPLGLLGPGNIIAKEGEDGCASTRA